VKKDKGEEDNFNTNDNNPFAGAQIGSGATQNASRYNPRPVSREYSRGPVRTPNSRFDTTAGTGVTRQEPAWMQPISGGRYQRRAVQPRRTIHNGSKRKQAQEDDP